MKGMSTFRNDVRLLSGQPEAEAEGLQADGATVVLVI